MIKAKKREVSAKARKVWGFEDFVQSEFNRFSREVNNKAEIKFREKHYSCVGYTWVIEDHLYFTDIFERRPWYQMNRKIAQIVQEGSTDSFEIDVYSSEFLPYARAISRRYKEKNRDASISINSKGK